MCLAVLWWRHAGLVNKYTEPENGQSDLRERERERAMMLVVVSDVEGGGTKEQLLFPYNCRDLIQDTVDDGKIKSQHSKPFSISSRVGLYVIFQRFPHEQREAT